jgi:hypothetical protein
MGKPDNQQKSVAGEYYVAFILSRLGYLVAVTLGGAKAIDMMASGPSGNQIKIQVKSTYHGYDWLVHEFDPSPNSVVALVRLGKDRTGSPELIFLRAALANKLIDSETYPTHSPRTSTARGSLSDNLTLATL